MSDESDSITGTGSVEKVKNNKKSAPQWVEQIKKDNYCEEHAAACHKPAGREHHQYARDELGLWAMLLVSPVCDAIIYKTN